MWEMSHPNIGELYMDRLIIDYPMIRSCLIHRDGPGPRGILVRAEMAHYKP